MIPEIFNKLQEGIPVGTIFTHTNYDVAAERIKARIDSQPEKLMIAVFGDDNVNQPKLVCQALISVLGKLGKKEDVGIVIGKTNSLDKIVKNFAAKSNIESFVITKTDKEWQDNELMSRDTIDRIIALSDVVIIISSVCGSNRFLKYPYEQAVSEGCFVVKRVIGKQNGSKNITRKT